MELDVGVQVLVQHAVKIPAEMLADRQLRSFATPDGPQRMLAPIAFLAYFAQPAPNLGRRTKSFSMRAVSASSRESSRYACSCSRVTSVMAAPFAEDGLSVSIRPAGIWAGCQPTRGIRMDVGSYGNYANPPRRQHSGRDLMPIAPSAQVHPTAVVLPEAPSAPNVQRRAFAVIEGPVDHRGRAVRSARTFTSSGR